MAGPRSGTTERGWGGDCRPTLALRSVPLRRNAIGPRHLDRPSYDRWLAPTSRLEPAELPPQPTTVPTERTLATALEAVKPTLCRTTTRVSPQAVLGGRPRGLFQCGATGIAEARSAWRRTLEGLRWPPHAVLCRASRLFAVLRAARAVLLAAFVVCFADDFVVVALRLAALRLRVAAALLPAAWRAVLVCVAIVYQLLCAVHVRYLSLYPDSRQKIQTGVRSGRRSPPGDVRRSPHPVRP